MENPVIHALCVLLQKFEKLDNIPHKNFPGSFILEGVLTQDPERLQRPGQTETKGCEEAIQLSALLGRIN